MGAGCSTADRERCRRLAVARRAARDAHVAAYKPPAVDVPAALKTRIVDATVTELVSMLESREVTSVQVVATYIERAQRIGYGLRAAVEDRFVEALADAAASDARRARGEPVRLL